MQTLQVGFGQLHVGRSLGYGMLVEPVITCFVYEVQHHLCGVIYKECGVLCGDCAVGGLRLQQVTKVHGAVGVAHGVTRKSN